MRIVFVTVLSLFFISTYASAQEVDVPTSKSFKEATDHCQVPDNPFKPENYPISIVRIDPIYPIDAAIKGVQGFVWIEFNVNKKGNVEDPTVLCTYPLNVFENAGITAVLGFKYEPLIVDKKPVDTKGIRVMITFELAN